MEINIKILAKKSLLEIKEDEEELYKEELTQILMIIGELPKQEGNPFFLDKKIVMEPRPDVIEDSLSRESLLKNAPIVEAACFSVPKIMDE